ncbi:MAG: hypothetical protein ABJA37_15335 [Ferruginibacter sp.]
MNLTCKIQYNTFEPGEFTGIKNVDFQTALNTIENFPWNKQREHIIIDLTCPSVSFEYSPDSILKLELYFNNKFVLNFFDGEHLYSKSFINYKLSYPFIKYFFEHQTIDFTTYKKENTIFKNINKHFITNEFIYTVRGKTLWQLLDFGTIIFSATLIFLFFMFMFGHPHKPLQPFVFIISPLFFLLYGGINYILLVNYYLYSKNKTLQLSQGSKIFWWGNPNNIKEYNKSDVEKIIIRQNKGKRCPWGEFTLTFLYLKTGEIIKIPSTFLSGGKLLYKMPETPSKIKGSFIPFCKLKDN